VFVASAFCSSPGEQFMSSLPLYFYTATVPFRGDETYDQIINVMGSEQTSSMI